MSVTVEQVRAYRDEHGVGILDAKRILEKEDRLERLRQIRRRSEGGHLSRPDLNMLLQILIEMNL